MSDSYGNALKLTIFGESHGRGIGIVIDGLPPGLELDMDFIRSEMLRRAPGRHKTATPRKEGDEVEILSGYFRNKTTGSALCGVIRNNDNRSMDYTDIKKYYRPGHADYPAHIKYEGFEDYRGGGHFSGRITAPFVFAGAICKQYLQSYGINIYARVKSIGNVIDKDFDIYNETDVENIVKAKEMYIPALSKDMSEKMEEEIMLAHKDNDSVGGVIETVAFDVPAGLGNPFFDSVESSIAHLAFSIPAIKGIEFGTGFDITKMRGSNANGQYIYEDDMIKTNTNHNGGILGGITNGMPVVFRVAVKPTPSISQDQKTISKDTNEESTLLIKGRHDPSIVPRVVPVMESVCAVALADLLIEKNGR